MQNILNMNKYHYTCNYNYKNMQDIETYLKNKLDQSNPYIDNQLHIDNCYGTFPDLSKFKSTTQLYITNCVFHSSQIHSFPKWIKCVSIVSTNIRELPELPENLFRLIISCTSLEKLPDILPSKLMYFVLEKNPKLKRIASLPDELSMFTCIDTSVRELPPLPVRLYRLYCWNNELIELPRIPCNVRYLRCANNPFTLSPWINDLHKESVPRQDFIYETAFSYRETYIDVNQIQTVYRFREIYYAVKFREKFRRWLWIPRERIIKRNLHPDRLIQFLDNTEDDLETALDEFFQQNGDSLQKRPK